MTLKLAFALPVVLILASPALGQPDSRRPERPATYDAVVRCRAISEEAARLRCFDTAVAALQSATESREVVVVDRAQVRESRRRLFGLALPSLPIFGGGGDDDEEEEVNSIESPVASAYQQGYGRWVVRLEDGSVWAQVDNQMIAARPRAGDPVRVQRGAMGSFMMRVRGQPAVRVRRQM